MEQKITADQATVSGCIDALDIVKHPGNYDRKSLASAKQHINRYKFAKKFVADKRIVDAACGTGYGSEILGQNYQQYLGIDLLKENIDLARRKFGTSDKKNFQEGDVTKKELEKNSVNLFISFETIEHIKNYDDFLYLVQGALKPDGEFIVSTPNRHITNAGASFADRPKWGHHEQEWILEEFIELLKKHNFKIKKIYGQSFFLNKKIANLIPGLHQTIKALTQSVRPLWPWKLIAQPNFYIIRCQK